MGIRRITAAFVYTLDGEPLRNGYVEYDDTDGRIISVGRCEAGEEVSPGALVPGFVNAHCHVELSHLHKKFRKGTGMAGFIDQINALRDWAGREVKSQLVQEWMDKMWDDGVSAMADISNDDSSFDVKKNHKMYTRTFLEVFGSEPEMCENVMKEVAELKKTADDCGIDAAPTPHSCYTMSPQLLSASAAKGLESGFLSYHSQESQEEEDLLLTGSGAMYENRKRSGMSTPPVTGESSLKYFLSRLAETGSAPYDGHILLVHNVCLQQDDIDAVKKAMNNVYFAVCPLSNIFIHNALPPVDLMRKNSLAITVGTDSLSSNDDLDMVKELVCLHDNFPGVPMEEIFEWACLNGARFLGKDDMLGSLAPGKCPGIVIVDGIDENGFVTDGSRSRRVI
ncbi:MAG: amidohydrolase family protein [Bacteroidales bacterium]|nr:amidohydrolase family protein [Bacteroidales bacterium]